MLCTGNGLTKQLSVLGTWFCIDDGDILFLLLLTNVLIRKSIGIKASAECGNVNGMGVYELSQPIRSTCMDPFLSVRER